MWFKKPRQQIFLFSVLNLMIAGLGCSPDRVEHSELNDILSAASNKHVGEPEEIIPEILSKEQGAVPSIAESSAEPTNSGNWLPQENIQGAGAGIPPAAGAAVGAGVLPVPGFVPVPFLPIIPLVPDFTLIPFSIWPEPIPFYTDIFPIDDDDDGGSRFNRGDWERSR